MTHPFSAVSCRRWLAGVLAVLVGLGPLATPTYAALTLLADEPLNVQNKAQPNIMLTVDDSTSMLFDFLPDSVVGTYCRDITGKMGAACGTSGQNTDLTATGRGKYVTPGHIFEQYGMPFGLTNPVYDASGPGAGCLFTPVGSTTCAGGVPPGALPGLDVYPNPPGPPPAKSPKAGQPYEYWTLWPAPVHNGAFNHAYYDPRLTYVPPVYADGTDYPQMNAANTVNWTHVPADPWAASVQYVDLTAMVTVGLWCNSDWSIGNENNPAYCRTNGTGPGAATSSGSSLDGDYNYPWAPPGIDPMGPVAVGSPTIAKSIAYSKVDGSGVLQPAWATAQDPRYFYENDNILWCDATSPLWPQTGPTTKQICVGGANVPQQCMGRVDQTCSAGTSQTCNGATPDSCAGVTTQTCGPLMAQHCGGATGQTCDTPPSQTCAGVGTQTCDGISPQTCDGVTPQTCTNITGQTCNNVHTQTCNLVAPSCIPPNADTCTTSWLADGQPDTAHVCPCTGGECPVCTPVVTCPQGTCSSNGASCDTAATCPSTGTCSFIGNACTSSGECATQPGICSRDGVPGCFVDGDCSQLGNCSTQTLTTCHLGDICPTIPGHCSIDIAQTCLDTGPCGAAGHCSLVGNLCHTAGADPIECPMQPGHCTASGIGCFADSPDCDRSSTCSATGALCTTTCPAVGGTCSIDGQICAVDADCGMASHCSLDHGVACHVTGSDPAECPDHPGACVVSGVACTGAVTDCPPRPDGHCSTSGLACSTTAGCPNLGQNCSVTGEACSSTPYVPYCTYPAFGTCSEPSYCPIQGGTCSVDGSPCPGPANPYPIFDAAAGVYWGSYFYPPYYDLTLCDNALTVGHCSIDTGTRCYSNNVPDPLCAPHAGPSGSASCSDMLSDNSKSLLEDANGPGLVCRHNNKSGGGYSSLAYDYPNSTYNTPVTAGTGANACVASPRYAAVPRHYYKTSVEWCNLQVAGSVAATPKWVGYGDRSMGTCQDDQDEANGFRYPRFYQFGQPAGTDNVAIPAFQRLDMDPLVNPTFDHGLDPFGDPIHRTFGGATPDVSEMTNYANWYAYYRTRITAVKTVTSLAFKEIDSKYRVGFHTLVDGLSNVPPHDIPPVFLNVDQFDDASTAHQKPTWYSKLFGVTVPLGNETPSLQALVRIGEYYKTGTHPRLTGAVDPIILSCSKNFHLFFTDGYTNEAAVPTDVVPGDQDNKVPTYPYFATAPISGLTPGGAWPHPFQEDAASELTQNALSDYAMYYWVTDLQHSGPAVHNVLATDTDPATWQHQNFAAVSLGTTGKLPTAQQSVTEAALAAGTLKWPVPSPNVFHPDNSGVDDLWHAATNGRGQFVNAQSVDEVKLGIGQVLADIAAQSGARAGAGLQSTSVGASSNFIYRARFEPGWAGSLTKEQIDPHTGLKVAEVWKAATQLAAQLAVGAAPNDKPWFTNRKIVTMNEAGTAAVPFLYDSLGVAQRDSLFPPNTLSKVAREKAVLEFLRGNAANEGTKLGQFRKRKAFLGDIVDASPVYVGVQPNAAYRDGDDPGYSTFKATTTRPAQVYVSANDGMLHAFDDATGNETWAYVPRPLYRGGLESFRILEDPLAGDAKSGLGALSYQAGALPPFKHHYMVDGPLKVADVDFGGQHWHTILVGGMGKGGNRYFALDVTNPADVTNEATAASKVLWEFSDPNMGFTYGKPMIAKTNAFGGAWLVIVASGYNNADGHGHLYFIDASNGHLKTTMTTSGLDGGSPGTPSGLAHPAGYTQDFRNQLAEQIYAGDLLGDFWRFDISDTDPSHWTVGKMARLVDPSHNPQPVTTPPQIEVDASNGVDRWVFVGTGKLYDDSDLTDFQVQTMYAFRDGTQTAPVPFPDPSFPLSRDTPGMQPIPHVAGTTKFGLASKPANGWYDDLPGGAASQRIVVAPQAAITIVAYVGTSPQTDPCLTGQTANIYAREFATGATVLFNGGGTPLESFASAEGAVGLEIVGFDTAPGAAQPDIRLAITLGTTGEVTFVNVTLPPNLAGHRMSWRLLGQ
jgi:type IV pilus assembly protein PilY1